MDDMLTTVNSLLEAGLPALLIVINIVLWRAYQLRTAEYIDALREIAGLRAQLTRNDQSLLFPRSSEMRDSGAGDGSD